MASASRYIACIFFQVAAILVAFQHASGQGSELIFARAGSFSPVTEPMVYAAPEGTETREHGKKSSIKYPSVAGIAAMRSLPSEAVENQNPNYRMQIESDGWYKISVNAASESALSGPVAVKVNRDTRLVSKSIRHRGGSGHFTNHDLGFIFLQQGDSLLEVEVAQSGIQIDRIAFEKLDNADFSEPIVSGLKIYPYPWQGRILNIMWPGEHLLKIVLVDRDGTVMLDFPFEEGMKNQASVMFTGKEIAAGVYFLQVHTRTKVKTVPVDHI